MALPIPTGWFENLDVLSGAGFPGLEGIKPGMLPTDLPNMAMPDGIANPLSNIRGSLDEVWAPFDAAMQATGPATWSAWTRAGLSAVGKGLSFVPGIGPAAMAGSQVLDWFFEKLGQRDSFQAEESLYTRCKKIEAMLMEGLVPPSLGGAVRASVTIDDLPSYTDCNDPVDPRRRTVVTPQKEWAPWTYSLNGDVPFRQPSGNCGAGFAVQRCGDPSGTYNKKRRGAGGKRCHGAAQFTALLWPWWCGNGPPRLAPAVCRGGSKPQDCHLYSDPNAMLDQLQVMMLGDPLVNAQSDLQKVMLMRDDLETFLGVLRIENAKGVERVTTEQVLAAIGMCDAFINARVTFMKSAEFRDQVTMLAKAKNPSLDLALYRALEIEHPYSKIPLPKGLPWPTNNKGSKPGAKPGAKMPERIRDKIAQSREPVVTGIMIQNPDAKPDPEEKPKRKPMPRAGGKGSSMLPIVLAGGAIATGLVIMNKKKR